MVEFLKHASFTGKKHVLVFLVPERKDKKNCLLTGWCCGRYSNPLWSINILYSDQAGGNCWGQIHKRAHPLTQQRWRTSHRMHRWTELCLWWSRSVVSGSDLKSQQARSAGIPQIYTSHKNHWLSMIYASGRGLCFTYQGLACLRGLRRLQRLFPAAPALQCPLCTGFPPAWPWPCGRFLFERDADFKRRLKTNLDQKTEICFLTWCNFYNWFHHWKLDWNFGCFKRLHKTNNTIIILEKRNRVTQ